MYMKGFLPVDLWLGRGSPLNPYLKGYLLKGYLIEYRRRVAIEAFACSALIDITSVLPPEYYELEAIGDFRQYSTLRAWVRDWLRYVKWYWSVAMKPDVSFDELFDSPQINRKAWKYFNNYDRSQSCQIRTAMEDL